MYITFPCYLLVTSGYLVITSVNQTLRLVTSGDLLLLLDTSGPTF